MTTEPPGTETIETTDKVEPITRISAESQEEAQNRQKLMRMRELLAASGIPLRHLRMLVEVELVSGWADACQKIVGAVGSGFLTGLLGSPGVGKTQIAASACHRSCWIERRAIYLEAVPLMMQVRDGRAGQQEYETYRKFCAPRLLVIDQMEELAHSDYEDRLLFQIINRRYNDELDTLLISNESPENFLNHLGSSIRSRMAQCGEVIQCDWPSFRDDKQAADRS